MKLVCLCALALAAPAQAFVGGRPPAAWTTRHRRQAAAASDDGIEGGVSLASRADASMVTADGLWLAMEARRELAGLGTAARVLSRAFNPRLGDVAQVEWI